MNAPRIFHVLIVLAIVAVCTVQLGGPNSLQVQSAAKEPAAAGEERTATETKDVKELEVRYAKIFDQLARVNLQAAEELNQKIPGMFSNTYINRLKELVTVADNRLAALESGAPMGNVRLIRAQVDVNIAEKNLQRALDANKQSAGAMSNTAVERLRLHRDLAQVNLDRAKIAAESPSQMVDMQWQLDRLQDSVWELRSSIDSITSRR
jgi:SMC interacting uncharacterized protein involved in chromosome segregation